MDGFFAQQRLSTCSELSWIAIILLEPGFEHFVDGGALPGGVMLRLDRIQRTKVQYRLRIESERVRLQPIEVGDRNPPGPSLQRRLRRGTPGRPYVVAGIDRLGEPFEPLVARHPASHCLQSQPKARGNGRRTAVVLRTRQQHTRCAERAHEVMGGEARPELKTRKTQRLSDLRRKPGIGIGQGRPIALVHAAQHHQVGFLKPSFDQAPDENPGMAAEGTPHRQSRHLATQDGNDVFRRHADRGSARGLLKLGKQFGREPSVRAAPGSVPCQLSHRFTQLRSDMGQVRGEICICQ